MKLRHDGKDYDADGAGAKRLDDGSWIVNGKRVWVARTATGIEAWHGGRVWRFQKADESSRRGAGHGAGDIVSPMTGKVRQVLVRQGASVDAGAVLVIVEAMKMEYRVVAPVAGLVTAVHAKDGALVEMGQELAVVTPSGKETGGKPG